MPGKFGSKEDDMDAGDLAVLATIERLAKEAGARQAEQAKPEAAKYPPAITALLKKLPRVSKYNSEQQDGAVAVFSTAPDDNLMFTEVHAAAKEVKELGL
jgi:hypothetical protein